MVPIPPFPNGRVWAPGVGLTRREFAAIVAGGAAAVAGCRAAGGRDAPGAPFRLRYVLASSLYGTMPLATVVAQVRAAGATHLDLWPRIHADHREQMEAMGHDAFLALIGRHGVRLGILTRYDLGPFALREEIAVARKLGASLVVTGSRGVERSDDPSRAVRDFVAKLAPTVAAAEEAGVTVGIENHAGSLIEDPDSMRRFAEAARSERLGIAFAPYHLLQDPALQASLIRDLGPKLVHFYAWQHHPTGPPNRPHLHERLQLPGLGPLDFAPLLAALRGIGYLGWTEPFMHPTPRGSK